MKPRRGAQEGGRRRAGETQQGGAGGQVKPSRGAGGQVKPSRGAQEGR